MPLGVAFFLTKYSVCPLEYDVIPTSMATIFFSQIGMPLGYRVQVGENSMGFIRLWVITGMGQDRFDYYLKPFFWLWCGSSHCYFVTMTNLGSKKKKNVV